MMSDETKTYGRFDPRGLKGKQAGLVMAMGFAGLLLVFAIIALQELK